MTLAPIDDVAKLKMPLSSTAISAHFLPQSSQHDRHVAAKLPDSLSSCL